VGYLDAGGYQFRKWLVCQICGRGSFLDYDGQLYPAPRAGTDLEGLPDEINGAWDEARTCFSHRAFTACELICRKILMHVAADKGAKAGESFAFYINYLVTEQYITPHMRDWVDQIRKSGNEATHQLHKPDQARAESTLDFTSALLLSVYTMAAKQAKYAPTPTPPAT
jgi:hypothetical protein